MIRSVDSHETFRIPKVSTLSKEVYTEDLSRKYKTDVEFPSIYGGEAFKVYTNRQIDKIPQIESLSGDVRFAMKVVSSVLPFRVNEYVINNLINWNNVPNDPIFQLTFPQVGMLSEEHFDEIASLISKDPARNVLDQTVKKIRRELNPHPAGQMELNVPRLNGDILEGVQHKYKETVLFFPSQGQTCHSYCTFCFRWAQFVGDKELKFASHEAKNLHEYLSQNTSITDLLITGGDPMVMKTKNLSDYLDPLCEDPRLEHVQTIRIGTKSLTFWPQRFVSDNDSDDLLRLLERLVKSGKHVALMAHYNHWCEMETDIARKAIKRVQETGAIIRSQGPVLAHINDHEDIWAQTWRTQVKLGIIPYYMFVERDTGARCYFEIPLVKASDIYTKALKQVSGLGRTVRGPSMSADPGKIEVQGVSNINGEKVFVLRFIQGRNSDWVQKPFFAKYDEDAKWLNDLTPAFGEEKFFFEDEFNALKESINLKTV